MWRNNLRVGTLMMVVAVTIVACGTSHQAVAKLTGAQLATRVLPAPFGYTLDSTPDSSGTITPAVFAYFGGASSPSALGFVAASREAT